MNEARNIIQQKDANAEKTEAPACEEAAKETEKPASTKTPDTQANQYNIVINNPDKYGYSHKKIVQTFVTQFTTFIYLCMADEKGSTFHTHIFVCFTSRVRFSKIKKAFPEAHIEKAKGTVSANVNYIKKSGKWENDAKHDTKIEGTFEEYGNRPPDSKGKRADMTELFEMVSAGMTNAEILAANQDYITIQDKINLLRTTLLIDKYGEDDRTDLKVIYISGSTRTGKTSSVLHFHRKQGQKVYRVSDYAHPFDHYEYQPVIVFDEFRSQLKLEDMLQYCDIYPIQLTARYSNRFACFLTVYIISNWPLEWQYRNAQISDTESWDAFLERIHEVRIFTKENVTIYPSAKDYINRFKSTPDIIETDNPFLAMHKNREEKEDRNEKDGREKKEEKEVHVVAYKGLRELKRSECDSDRTLEYWEGQKLLGSPMKRPENFEPDAEKMADTDRVYEYEACFEFEAGSPPEYKHWLLNLDEFKGKTAFQGLIGFLQFDGVIGPELSAKLRDDFVKYHDEAMAFAKGEGICTYFFEKYCNWEKAFSMAAENGAVEFS